MELSAIDEEVDRRRLAGLRALDKSLLLLAHDDRFQRHLQCPIVKLALKCWVGGRLEHLNREELQQIQVRYICIPVHTSYQQNLTHPLSTRPLIPIFQTNQAVLEVYPSLKAYPIASYPSSHAHLNPPLSIHLQTNQAVLEVYPSLKALDDLCEKIEIRFPIDHIAASKHELCQVTTNT